MLSTTLIWVSICESSAVSRFSNVAYPRYNTNAILLTFCYIKVKYSMVKVLLYTFEKISLHYAPCRFAELIEFSLRSRNIQKI